MALGKTQTNTQTNTKRKEKIMKKRATLFFHCALKKKIELIFFHSEMYSQ
jgi:hypothetical protein